jgi:hypothetical protein
VNLRADDHYDVVRNNGANDHILRLRCKHVACTFSVDVKALHKAGDKSGAGRYCRARNRMVRHWHAEHISR